MDVDARWQQDIVDLLHCAGTSIVLTGESPDVQEAKPVPSEYRVVTREQVQRGLAWLNTLYETVLLRHLEALTGIRLVVLTSRRMGININMISGYHGRYEKHVDPGPVTAILFCTTLASEDGGQLLIEQDGVLVSVRPRAGRIVVFNGGTNPHSVQPLRYSTDRVSIPMHYHLAGVQQPALDELERYLYGPPLENARGYRYPGPYASTGPASRFRLPRAVADAVHRGWRPASTSIRRPRSRARGQRSTPPRRRRPAGAPADPHPPAAAA